MIPLPTGAISTAIASSSEVAGAASATTGASNGTASAFSGVLQFMIDQTSTLDAQAKQAVSGLLGGQGVDIHDAMIATEKADMAFELALQVRNKAVGAYQQMMSMQF